MKPRKTVPRDGTRTARAKRNTRNLKQRRALVHAQKGRP